MKNIIKNWLEKLAKANEESLGTGRLDCCELNKDNNFKNSKTKMTSNNNNFRNKRN